jgi:DNA (cytosine-5)-methyltransferase 1
MVRNPVLRLAHDEIIGDGFAGGGGASLGLELALGRKVDIAINHDPEAIAMHKANHPETEHYIEDIYDVDPRVVTHGKPVGVMWFSPDCTDHSRAKNASIKRDKKVRCLANVILTWVGSVRPRVIVVENVLEFEDWGPLDEDNKIDKLRKGEYFKFWWRRFEDMGYRGEMRYLKACDYGAPTSRERLYIVWRCDGGEIGWPDVSHGPKGYEPFRTAAECINYELPCPSIFMDADDARELYSETGIRCNRPLSDNTLARIGTGMWKHVLTDADPFVVPVTHPRDQRTYDIREPFRTVTAAARGEFGLVSPFVVPFYGKGHGGNVRGHDVIDPLPTITTARRFGMVAPTLVQTGYGERPGQAPRCLDLQRPLGTIVSGGTGGNGKHGLVAAYLTKEFGDRATGGWGGSQPITAPMGSITTRDHHRLAVGQLVPTTGDGRFSEVRAFLSRYNGQSVGQDLRKPIGTLDCNDRYALVYVGGEAWAISDIGFRMLVPRELFRAQGFPDSYVIDPLFDYVYTSSRGRRRVVRKQLTATAQIDKCGNSVSPPVARGIIRANFPITASEAAPIRAVG